MSITPEQQGESRSQLAGRRLRGAQAYLGLKQVDLARALNMSQSAVSQLLNGHTAFTLDHLEAIEESLGIRMLYLVTGEAPMFTEQKISGGPLGGAAAKKKKESFLSESNRRPFHYKRDESVVIPFPSRHGLAEQSVDGGLNATIIDFPGRAA